MEKGKNPLNRAPRPSLVVAQYLVSLPALERNARILSQVAQDSGAQIVLALKAFSLWPSFPTLQPHLAGCCASGLWEAELSHLFFQKETLTYSPAYSEKEIARLLEISNHLDFNSLTQWQHFRELCLAHPRAQAGEIHFGLRINPLHSTGSTPLYDPCSSGSRLGVTADQLQQADLRGLSTLHFHTLCEQPVTDLVSTIRVVEEDFGDLLASNQITQLNLGGGHWITQPDYDCETLVSLIRRLSREYQVQVWLEPGEALAIHAGVLRAQVLDVFESQGIRHVILDVSATCHMPDVLEMPYRPEVFLVTSENSSSQQPVVTLPHELYQHANEQGSNLHRLGGPSCLAGDVIGDYSFSRPLVIGDTLLFDDMAHYTFVKSTFFNGVPHPDLALLHADGQLETLRRFTFEDFAGRLGCRV